MGATYRKKAIYKFVKKVAKKPAVAKKQIFAEKKVGGAKNGGTRMVRVAKLANDYPTVDAAPKGTSVNFFSKHKRTVRDSLSAGTVAIVLTTSRQRREPKRMVRSLTPRRKNTSLPSSERLTRALLTLRFWLLSRSIRKGLL